MNASQTFVRTRNSARPRVRPTRKHPIYAARQATVIPMTRTWAMPTIRLPVRAWMQAVQRTLPRPHNRLLLAASAGVLVLLLVAAIAINYVFGGSDKTYHRPITAPTLVATNGGTLFTLDPASTTASFTIHEVLFGNPKTVLGQTNQVAGQILIDQRHPGNSELSTIRVDVSTLTTDSAMRTHTLHSRILETDDAANEYATFVPTSYSNVPAHLSINVPVTFQLHGNLTVHQVTQPETFTVRLTLTSATQLSGTATTTVQYKDFHLAIPNIPFVSGVGNTVTLTLSFAAIAKTA